MSFIKNYILGAISEAQTSNNPLEEVRNNKFFSRVALNFSIEEKTKLYNALEKLYDDYPVLKSYAITLIGIGADTAGNCQVANGLTATIKLGNDATYATVVHELGHIIAKHIDVSSLDMSYANEYECSVYALTSKEELFCELISNKYCSQDRFKVQVANRLLNGLNA